MPNGHERLDGTVRAASFLGTTIRYEVEVNGDIVKVMTPPEIAMDPGARVNLTFPPRASVAVARSDGAAT